MPTKQDMINVWKDRISDVDRAIEENRAQRKELISRRRKLVHALETVEADMDEYPVAHMGTMDDSLDVEAG